MMYILKENRKGLKEAGQSVDFDQFFDTIGKVKVTGIHFVKNKEINVMDPGSSKAWNIKTTGQDTVLITERDKTQIHIAIKMIRHIAVEKGCYEFTLKSGSVFRVFYED